MSDTVIDEGLPELPPLHDHQWRPSRPVGFGFAIGLLWCFLAVELAVIGWRMFEALTRVRSDRIAEFLFEYLKYPALYLALLIGALLGIRKARVVGPVLGAALLGYMGIIVLHLAWQGSGAYPSPASRTIGRTISCMLGLTFWSAATSLGWGAWTQGRASASK